MAERRMVYGGVVIAVSRDGVVLDDHAVSLWGVEANHPDTDDIFLKDTANEMLPEALAAGRAALTRLCAARNRQAGRQMKPYTAHCFVAAYEECTITVESETPEDAAAALIEKANASDEWSPTDHCGPTFVDSMIEGDVMPPWAERGELIPIPMQFREHNGVLECNDNIAIALLAAAAALRDLRRGIPWRDLHSPWSEMWPEIVAALEAAGIDCNAQDFKRGEP